MPQPRGFCSVIYSDSCLNEWCKQCESAESNVLVVKRVRGCCKQCVSDKNGVLVVSSVYECWKLFASSASPIENKDHSKNCTVSPHYNNDVSPELYRHLQLPNSSNDCSQNLPDSKDNRSPKLVRLPNSNNDHSPELNTLSDSINDRSPELNSLPNSNNHRSPELNSLPIATIMTATRT